MKIWFTCLLLLVITLSGCSKKSTHDVQPLPPAANGSISGMITPKTGALLSLVVHGWVEGRLVSYQPVEPILDTAGHFKFTGLPAGSYMLSFKSVDENLFLPPDSIKVTVKSGSNTEVGTITFKGNPNNGSISGIISPAGAAGTVLALHNNMAPVYSAVIDPATGKFTDTNIPPGDYTVTFIPYIGYNTPDFKTVTVKAGQNTDAGIFSFVPYGKSSLFSCLVNGNALSLSANVTYVSPDLGMLAVHSDGSGDGSTLYHLNIRLNTVTGPGTFTCTPTSASEIDYSWAIAGYIGSGGGWTSQAAGGSATVTVTAIDPVAHTMSGTFSATLVQKYGAGKLDNQVITDGKFVASYK